MRDLEQCKAIIQQNHLHSGCKLGDTQEDENGDMRLTINLEDGERTRYTMPL